MMKKNIVLIVVIAVVVVGLALWLLVFSEGAGTFIGMKKSTIKPSSSLEFESLVNKASYLTANEKNNLENVVPGKIYIVPEDNFCVDESLCKNGVPLMQKGSYFVMTSSEGDNSVNQELLAQVFSESDSRKQEFEISEEDEYFEYSSESGGQWPNDGSYQPWSNPDCTCGCILDRHLRVFYFMDGGVVYWWELSCSNSTCWTNCWLQGWSCYCGVSCCWAQ